MLEEKIVNLAYQIYELTKAERSRPVDMYGRIHRQGLPENFIG